MNKLAILFLCSISDISARLIHCNTKEGKWFCKYSNSCIDITDECKTLFSSYNYLNSLFW